MNLIYLVFIGLFNVEKVKIYTIDAWIVIAHYVENVKSHMKGCYFLIRSVSHCNSNFNSNWVLIQSFPNNLN